jgi:hypothetical protein
MGTVKQLSLLLVATALLAIAPARAQDAEAPNITGTSIQGAEVDLESFRGDKSVLVVFYRTHT